MYDVNRVLSVAAAEVGYLEKANNKNLDGKTENAGDKNYTKYARDLDAIPGFYNGRKQGYQIMTGEIKDFRIYEAALNDTQISTLRQAMKG